MTGRLRQGFGMALEPLPLRGSPSYLDVNPIIFGDEFDGVRGKEMGVGRDAHFCEDLAAGGEIAGKRSVGDASYTGQF